MERGRIKETQQRDEDEDDEEERKERGLASHYDVMRGG